MKLSNFLKKKFWRKNEKNIGFFFGASIKKLLDFLARKFKFLERPDFLKIF